MIYELTQDLAANLRAQGMPFPVIAGPERARRELGRSAIIIERDSDVSDSVSTARGQQVNPRKRMTRELAGRARIYAASTLSGAHRGDHERLCEQLVDMLLVELDKWVIEAKAAQQIQVTEARYLKPAELDGDAPQGPVRTVHESPPGVAYLLRFRVPRAVFELSFKGEARPTGSPTAVHGDVEIRLNGSTEPPEIVELPE